VDEKGGFEIFRFAGGVGDAEKRVDGVAAASVDDGAGGAEESATECGVGDGGLLVGEEAVAPGLQELGVEIVIWGGWGFRGWRFVLRLCGEKIGEGQGGA